MAYIAPSILSADFSNLSAQVKRVEESQIKYLHLDIMDGHFVPNITFGPPVLKKLRPHTNLIFDTHLMIENPDRYIDDFVEAGSDIITVHAEACIHLHRTLQTIKDKNVKVGVALNPATPISNVKYILDMVDLVLVMSVNPGFGGQKFIESSIEKIEKLADIRKKKNLKFLIEVDGGINTSTIKDVVKAGADILVAGSVVFKDDEIENNIKSLKETLKLEY